MDLSRKLPQPATRSGFTLLELLLATLTFTMIVMIIKTTFHHTLALREQAENRVERLHPIQQTLLQIREDLKHLAFSNQLLASHFYSQPGENLLEAFVSSAPILNSTYLGDTQKVVYFLGESSSDPNYLPPSHPENQVPLGKTLIRAVTRNLLPSSQEEIQYQYLLSGIETIEFTFFNGTTWTETWDSDAETIPLPRAVKIEITLATLPSNSTSLIPVYSWTVPILAQPQKTATETTP